MIYLETLLALCQADSRVLDIGCGPAMPTLSRLPGRLRVGLDVLPELPGGPLHAVRGSGEALPFADATFDVVCCRSVLEHVEAPERLFAEAGRCLRAGGVFVFVTANRWDYVSLCARAVPNRWHQGLVSLAGGNPDKVFPTYYRANDVTAIRAAMAAAGLTCTRLDRLRQHPHYLRFSTGAYVVGAGLERVQRLLPWFRPWLLGVATRDGSSSPLARRRPMMPD
ncbi:MAG: class I SAM-dependent methyltransferase [Acidobacteria bacterium]|nr:class I SAM-dependent methyltransferase [Acidobacteriota bacterium]